MAPSVESPEPSSAPSAPSRPASRRLLARGGLALGFALLLVLAFGAGSKRGTRLAAPERRPGLDAVPASSAAALAALLGKEANDLTLPRDPILIGGDLRSELDSFTTLSACVEARAKVDPLVGDALDAIGYDGFLHDTCRLLEAAKTLDRSKCEPIAASALRERCATYEAIAAAKPDDCPVGPLPERGRDPLCLAVASRDARFCAATAPDARSLCTALASADDARCPAGSPRARTACVQNVRRWASVLGAIPPPGAPLVEAKSVLRLEPLEGSVPVLRPTLDLALDRGLVFYRHRGEARISIGAITETGGAPHAIAPFAPLSLGAVLVLSGPPPAAARVQAFELLVPGGLAIVDVDHKLPVRARVEALAPQRGAEVRLVLDAEGGVKPHAYKLHLEVTSWVRDVLTD